MIEFPQAGGCLCGDVRYALTEDPLYVYACHCTDCQTLTGSAFTLSAVVPRAALRLEKGDLHESLVVLDDGRRKAESFCPRCLTRVWAPARVPEFALLEPGTLDDTSWIRPAGHIWTRSAQPWLVFGPDELEFEKGAGEDGLGGLIHTWKTRKRS